MQYICKNPNCQAIFIDKDLYGRITPETYKYCPKCEEAGFPKIKEDKKDKNKIRVSTFK